MLEFQGLSVNPLDGMIFELIDRRLGDLGDEHGKFSNDRRRKNTGE